MAPNIKWKRSNLQLFSSTRSKDTSPLSSATVDTPSSPLQLAISSTLPLSHASAPHNNCTTTIIQTTEAASLPTALTLPEIILCVAEFLSRSTLAQCSLVCKDWRVIFQPLLFRIIEAADFDSPEFVRSFQNHTRFATSIEWIQEITPILPPPKKHTWHRIFRRKATPLKPSIDNRKPFEQLENSLLAGETPALETLSVRIQNQDPNLILRLSASTVVNLQISTRGYPARKPRVYLEDILQAYPNLVNLTLEGLFTLTSRLLKDADLHASGGGAGSVTSPTIPIIGATVAGGAGLTISAPFAVVTPENSANTPIPNMHHYSQVAIAAATAASSSTSSTRFRSESSTTNAKDNASEQRLSAIQTLNLRLVDISQDHLIAISALIPRLQALLIEEFLVPDMMIKIYRWTWSKEFIQSLRISFPQLQSIRLAIPFDTIKEDTIVEILKAFPLLKTVGFRNSCFGRVAMETLQEHCKLVECLDVSFGNANREFKPSLLRFLQSWPKLRELEADGHIFHLDTPLDDDVPTTIPWACTRLEKLICGFQGTESMIFQHLSQFPMLSSLTISYPAMNIFPIESTLAWMVKATRMEYFWFLQYRHLPLDRSTVQWVLTHWPNLKTLHVAGGLIEQKEIVKQWCRDAQRLSLVVEYDR
ncbi:hypothetical protein BG011_009433 [Mortierella polycephala]|uniref:F-box domain-containing protein n=1 Tax=Mortierella polycephala TaxID=41804 RepID=A0A9P6PLB3_9FUNG|nr:hypothetical protein BG011_009433 [Mortierella polycephala]